MEQPTETFRPTALTLPMVLVATALGTIVCVTNMYFGLLIGSFNTMSPTTALLAFAIFRGAERLLGSSSSRSSNNNNSRFTPAENAVVQTMASSIASMPLAASLGSVIPALEFLRAPEEGGTRRFSLVELSAWCLGVCLFGTIVAAPLRPYFLLRQRLRFPGPYAVGVLLGVLHGSREVALIAELDKQGSGYTKDDLALYEQPVDDDAEAAAAPSSAATTTNRAMGNGELPPRQDSETDWTPKIALLAASFTGTGLFAITSYFVPALTRVPIFGTVAADDYYWFVTLSPAFMAFGVIIGMSTIVSMLAGAVLGWGLLSHIAKSHGWAPGPVGDMENGARGWLLWICIGCLLGDAVGRILLPPASALFRLATAARSPPRMLPAPSDRSAEPLLQSSQPTSDDAGSDASSSVHNLAGKYRENQEFLVSGRFISVLMLLSVCLCVLGTSIVFWGDIPLYTIALSIALVFPLCLVVIQAAGETDMVPSVSISNACQFLLYLVLPPRSRVRLMSMIAAAITEAGLWQSAVLMGDLKTAYLVRASPKVMLRAQLLGSVIGAFVASIVYRVFIAISGIPNTDSFPLPLSHMWANTARLADGGRLPHGVAPFFIGAAIISAIMRAVAYATEGKSWARWLPSAVGISIGMYLPPPVVLGQVIGASLRVGLLWMQSASDISLMCVAAGCILGQGTLGLLPTIFEVLGVPRFL